MVPHSLASCGITVTLTLNSVHILQERPCLMFIKLSDDFNRHSCMAPRALRILFVPLADKVCAPPISLPLSLSLSLSLSLCFNGHFPGEPGLAGVY